MTRDCIVLIFSIQHFEKLEVNLTPESIYMKEECGLIKHTDIILYIYIYYIYITLYIYYIIYILHYILHYIYITLYIYHSVHPPFFSTGD